MKTYGWFREEYEKAKDTFEFKLEELELEITDKIIEFMEKNDLKRTDLANRLQVSKAAVTRLLNNGSNMTLKRLLAIADALDCELEIDLKSKTEDIRDDEEEVEEFYDLKFGSGASITEIPQAKPDDYSVAVEFEEDDDYQVPDMVVNG